MTRFREYGSGPYDVAVLHGGPGAAGEMAPVARALSRSRGVLEALQTASTVEGQLEELASTLRENASLPVSLIGHSWGAMLGLLFTAGNPDLVKKLILVNSGVLENRYAADIMKTRLGRMTEEDRAAVLSLTDVTTGEKPGNKNEAFSLLGAYISKADSFDPLPGEDEIIECRFDIYESVWGEAQELRSSGGLPMRPGASGVRWWRFTATTTLTHPRASGSHLPLSSVSSTLSCSRTAAIAPGPSARHKPGSTRSSGTRRPSPAQAVELHRSFTTTAACAPRLSDRAGNHY